MKLVLHDSNTYILCLDKGDEVKQTLADFCIKNNITAAHISGIGSTDDCLLAYYDPDKKNYIDHHFSGQHEVISILGNVTMVDGQPFPHLHASISDANLKTVSGHVQRLVTYITNEIILQKFNGQIKRRRYSKDNLLLID